MRTPPSAVKIVLHHYYSPEPYYDRQEGYYQQAVRQFIRDGILEAKDDPCPSVPTVTDKGKAWVEMMLSTPYPVEKTVFVHPETQRIIKL